jgi:hypothetical protein
VDVLGSPGAQNSPTQWTRNATFLKWMNWSLSICFEKVVTVDICEVMLSEINGGEVSSKDSREATTNCVRHDPYRD